MGSQVITGCPYWSYLLYSTAFNRSELRSLCALRYFIFYYATSHISQTKRWNNIDNAVHWSIFTTNDQVTLKKIMYTGFVVVIGVVVEAVDVEGCIIA